MPYNKYLCALFDAHINVESSTVKAVKYLYKYVYKSHDRGVFEVSVPNPEKGTNSEQVDVDEIARFVDARYISPPEAFWHIFHFSLHREYPKITQLPVKLAQVRNFSPLTKWFDLNKTDPEARKYLYHEIPFHYTYNNGWKRRKNSTFAIG